MADTPAQRVALVTGGSRGIGRAISLRLAADGFAVAVNYVGRQPEADETVEAITSAGGKAVAIKADVSNSEDAARLFEEAQAQLGQVTVLINSAGVLTMLPIATASGDEFDRIININVRGCFNTMQHAARLLPEGGRIINLSSSVVGMSLPAYGPYAAPKAALEVLSRHLAHELRGRKINVNCVAPGPTATELFFEGKTLEQVERLAMLSPLERIGEPDEIASVVAFLAGPEGTWINGQTIRVNGGTV